MVFSSNASLLFNVIVSFLFCLSFRMQDSQSFETGGLLYGELVAEP